MKFHSLGQRLFSLIRRQWACLSRVLHSTVMPDFHLICLCEGGASRAGVYERVCSPLCFTVHKLYARTCQRTYQRWSLLLNSRSSYYFWWEFNAVRTLRRLAEATIGSIKYCHWGEGLLIVRWLCLGVLECFCGICIIHGPKNPDDFELIYSSSALTITTKDTWNKHPLQGSTSSFVCKRRG